MPQGINNDKNNPKHKGQSGTLFASHWLKGKATVKEHNRWFKGLMTITIINDATLGSGEQK